MNGLSRQQIAAALALLALFSLSGVSQATHKPPSGEITRFPLPAPVSVPIGITAGPDNRVWFVEHQPFGEGGLCVRPGAVARIDAAGEVEEFPLPNSCSGPFGITSGPDGALWFTELLGHRIGRITTAGAISEYDLPPGSGPLGITVGPDGALWFTENHGNHVGRITTEGAITLRVPIPTPGSAPGDIVVGPDGALWFTETNTDKIGRITTAGLITEYALPSRGSRPEDITVGPDGALWFTEKDGARIGRITTGGAITEFPVTEGSAPTQIVVGPDKNLWFTQPPAGQIGRITTAGEVTEFAVPDTNPMGLTLGPDRALWFTAPVNNLVGRFQVCEGSRGKGWGNCHKDRGHGRVETQRKVGG